MDGADLEGRFQRDVAALQQAKTVAGNRSFILLFAICALVGLAGLLVVGCSGTVGWGLTAGVLAIGAGASFSGKADEIMVLGVAGISGLCGLLALAVSAQVIFGLH